MLVLARALCASLALTALQVVPSSQKPVPGSSSGSTELPAPGPSPAVLRIDGQEVSADEFGRWMIQNYGGRLSHDFAADWVVEREAAKKGVDVSQSEVDQEIDEQWKTRIDGAFLGKKEDWLKELERTQRSEPGLRTQRRAELRPELLARGLCSIDRVIPEEKIEREWELHYGRKGRKYNLSMIKFQVEFLTSPTGTPAEEQAKLRQAEIDEQKARALAVRERILRGEDFGDLAAATSDDPVTRYFRGRLPTGQFSHFGWPHSFLDSLDELEPGAVSEPLYARGGWWLVQVHDVAVTPLESVRAKITADILSKPPGQDETGTLRAALEKDTKIELLPTLFDESAISGESKKLVPGLRINGEEVARSTYATWMMRVRGESSWPHFLEHFVVERRAKQKGITVTDEDVRARAESYLQQLLGLEYQGSREAWRSRLASSGKDEGEFIRDLSVRMRIELFTERLMMLERVVTPEMVRERWEEVYGADGQRVDARWILLTIPQPPVAKDASREEIERAAEEAGAAVRAKADALVQRLRDGEDFAALARQYSEDSTTRDRGGLLPDRFRPERWPKPVADVVQALEPGTYTAPQPLGTAWAIFEVVAKRRIAFEEVKDDLAEQLAHEPPARPDLSAYRNVLTRDVKVEVLPPMYQ